jgi:1,4-dihydroxy-2-naphthoyl-CoA synthase
VAAARWQTRAVTDSRTGKSASTEQVLYDERDDIAIITINRPEPVTGFNPLPELRAPRTNRLMNESRFLAISR